VRKGDKNSEKQFG